MVRKLVLILSVVLFAVSFAAIAFASESVGTPAKKAVATMRPGQR
jgi:hypothetical protein